MQTNNITNAVESSARESRGISGLAALRRIRRLNGIFRVLLMGGLLVGGLLIFTLSASEYWHRLTTVDGTCRDSADDFGWEWTPKKPALVISSHLMVSAALLAIAQLLSRRNFSLKHLLTLVLGIGLCGLPPLLFSRDYRAEFDISHIKTPALTASEWNAIKAAALDPAGALAAWPAKIQAATGITPKDAKDISISFSALRPDAIKGEIAMRSRFSEPQQRLVTHFFGSYFQMLVKKRGARARPEIIRMILANARRLGNPILSEHLLKESF